MVSTIDGFLALGFVPDTGGLPDVWRLPSKNKRVDLSIVRGMSLKYGCPVCVTLHGRFPTGKHKLCSIEQDLPPECNDGQAFRAMLEYVLGYDITIDELLKLAQEET